MTTVAQRGPTHNIDRFEPAPTTLKYDPSRPLAFLHIPKTAGIAFGNALVEATGITNQVHGWDRSLFGDYSEFDTWDKGRMEHVFLSAEQMRAGADYVRGHLAESTIRYRYPNAQFLTIIREPSSRILSLWVFWRSTGDLSEIGTYERRVRRARAPLIEFLSDRCVAPQLDNVCVRMLVWPHPLVPGDSFIAPESDDILLDEALRRLERFDHIDTYENPAWPSRVESWLGRPMTIRKENVTEPVPESYRTSLQAEMTPEAAELLGQRARIDDRLWRAVARCVCGDVGAETLREKCDSSNFIKFARLLAGEI